MESELTGTAALVTGASSGIGAATARQLEHGASIALVARRRDRLEALAAEIDNVRGTALAVEADITDRIQAEAAVRQAVERFGRRDTLVNSAGLMLLGPVAGADPDEWDRMIATNVQGLLYTPCARPTPPTASRRGRPAPGRRHRQHQLDRRPHRLERLRRLQLHQVRRERIHRVPAPGSHPAARARRPRRARRRRDRAGLAQHPRDPQRDDRPLISADRSPRPRGHRRRHRLHGHPPRHTAIGELWIMPTEQL